MLAIIMIELKAFWQQQQRQAGTVMVSCLVLAVCLAITLLFSSLFEAMVKKDQFHSPAGTPVHTLVLAFDEASQQQLKPEAIRYLRTLVKPAAATEQASAVLDNIIAVNHVKLPIEVRGTTVIAQAEVVHFDGLEGLLADIPRSQWLEIESQKLASVILSAAFARRLEQQFNLPSAIKKGDNFMIRDQLFKVLGVAPSNDNSVKGAFSGFNDGNKTIDLWLPFHRLTFAKGLPASANMNGDFQFPGTHLYTYSNHTAQQIEAEVFWLEQVLDSMTLLPSGAMLTAIKGIQTNYHQYKNAHQLILLNLFGSILLLLLGAINFFRFRLVQCTADMSGFTTRMALGQDNGMILFNLLIQNVLLLLLVFSLAVLLLLTSQNSLLSQFDFGISAVNIDGLLKYGLLIVPSALLLTQLQLSAIWPQLSGNLAGAANQQTSKISQLLNLLIAATFFSSLLFMLMILKSFLAFEQLPYGYDGQHITVISVDNKVKQHANRIAYVPIELLQQTVQDTAATLGLAVALTSNAPMDGLTFGQSSFFVAAKSSGELEKTGILISEVSLNFFELLGIKFKSGRLFAADEGFGIVVNDAFARRFLAADQQLPVTIYMDAIDVETKEPIKIPRHIIGIVADYFPASKKGVVEPIIFKLLDNGAQMTAIVLKPITANVGIDSAVFDKIITALPDKKITDSYDLQARQQADSAEELGRMTIFMIVAGLNLAIFCLGVYTHLFQFMADKKRELAIRYAIGASNSDIMKYSFTVALWTFFPGSLLSLGGFGLLIYYHPAGLNGLSLDSTVLFIAISTFTLFIFLSSYWVYRANKEDALCADIFSEQVR